MINHDLQAMEEAMIRSLNARIREQDATIHMLDAALLALGATTRPEPAPWMVPLNPQQRALMGALYAAYPRTLDRSQLLQLIPSKSMDELERQPGIVNVIICKCRKELGFDALYNDRGIGYRMGDEFYKSIPKKTLDLAA